MGSLLVRAKSISAYYAGIALPVVFSKWPLPCLCYCCNRRGTCLPRTSGLWIPSVIQPRLATAAASSFTGRGSCSLNPSRSVKLQAIAEPGSRYDVHTDAQGIPIIQSTTRSPYPSCRFATTRPRMSRQPPHGPWLAGDANYLPLPALPNDLFPLLVPPF